MTNEDLLNRLECTNTSAKNDLGMIISNHIDFCYKPDDKMMISENNFDSLIETLIQWHFKINDK